VTWYTYPTPDFGFAEGATGEYIDAAPRAVSFTSQGASLFSYANPSTPATLKHTYAYYARPLDANTQPLLSDGTGNALAAVRRYADGRENLAFTFDSNPYLITSQRLGFGAIQWVTKGIFLGERRTWASAQVDDVLIGTEPYGGPSESEIRMTGADLARVKSWQDRVQSDPVTAAFKLDMYFNGRGAVAGAYADTTLRTAVIANERAFKWGNHTFTHLDLAAPTTAAQTRDEILRGNQMARELGLYNYKRWNLVTGKVSGLDNPQAMRAMRDADVRQIVSDTSRPGEDSPTPNTGIWNSLEPTVFMVPRRPTNLFYNVATPTQWTGLYNQLYRSYWGRDFSLEDILEDQSEMMVLWMVRGETNPWMFHQANLITYADNRFLLGDLLDRLFAKYKSLMSFPVLSPTMDELADTMKRRMVYNTSGVQATIEPGRRLILRAAKDTRVAVTGVSNSMPCNYGSVIISCFNLRAGRPITVTLR
jgi:hypothetical protein